MCWRLRPGGNRRSDDSGLVGLAITTGLGKSGRHALRRLGAHAAAREVPKGWQMIIRAALICSVLLTSSVCKAERLSWCGPDVVTLEFQKQQVLHQNRIEIELRPLSTPCGVNPEKNGVAQNVERSMRIRRNHRWVDVPSACLSGLAFGVGGLTISPDEGGVAISVAGKSTGGETDMQIYIYEIRYKISCALVEPDPNQDGKENTRFRWLAGVH